MQCTLTCRVLKQSEVNNENGPAYHNLRLERGDVLVDEGELRLDRGDVGHDLDDRRVKVSGELDVRLDRQDRVRQTGGKFKFKSVEKMARNLKF